MTAPVIAVANHKGGVAKTTTTVNLGAGLARLGRRVLIVDMDPQAHATIHVGVDRSRLSASMYDVMTQRVSMIDALKREVFPNGSLAPSHLNLAAAETELQSIPGRELVLRQALKTVTSDFDLVLIDCPPALGVLTMNAFAAAQHLLIPVEPEFFALDGIVHLMKLHEMVRDRLNADLDILGVVVTKVDPRVVAKLAMHADSITKLEAFFGSKLFHARVRLNARLKEAPSHGLSIFDHAPDSPGAQDYLALSKEVLDHVGSKETGSRHESPGLAHKQAG